MRSKPKLMAAALVALVALASAAHATFVITEEMAATEPGPLMTPMSILVSIRNQTVAPQTITMINRAAAGNADCPLSVQWAPTTAMMIPHTLPPDGQEQIRIYSSGFAATDPMPAICVWDVYSSDGPPQQFTTTFNLSASSPAAWDLQPKSMNFGSQSEFNDSEVQMLLIHNFTMTMNTFTDMVITNITEPGSITFFSQCAGQTTCTAQFQITAKTALPVYLQCDPLSANTAVGMFQILDNGVPLQTTMLRCTGVGGGGGMINIPNSDIFISGPLGVPTNNSGTMVTAPGPNAMTAAQILGADGGSFRILTQNCNSDSCVFNPSIPTDTSIDIECTPEATPRSAQLVVTGNANDMDSAVLHCDSTGGGGGIDIVETAINIVGPQLSLQSANANVTSNPQPNSVVSAQITGPDASAFTITNAGCNSQTCTFPAGSLPTDAVLQIVCTPNGNSRTALLEVRGPANDMDSAAVNCITSGPSGSLSVNPPSYDAMTVPVGMTAGPYTVTLTNGSPVGTLTAQAFLGDSLNWSVDDCTTVPCMLGPMQSRTINVTYHPMIAGLHNTVLTVDAGAAGMGTVSLFGQADTTESLNVISPASFQLAFGPLARNQADTKTVVVQSGGPSGHMITINDPGSVYTVTPQSVSTAPGGTGTFSVTCQSATASGPNTATLTISAFPTPDVQNTQTIGLTCTIEDTDVEVTPTSFPFGEVRVGTNERRMPFTIHNNGSPVTIDFVRILPTRPGLSVTTGVLGPLPANTDLNGEVILAPGSDVALDGAFLEIGIQGQPTRQLPITGAVVTPEATVTPAALDLGTVCIGTQVGGQVTMTNSGTATLRVERPMMDHTSFTANATPPDVYPLDLPVDGQATITIAPSTSAMDLVSSSLSWSVDAPGSPFRVPVSMTYVTTGGAASPNLVAFPPLDVFGTSPDRKITLQNCGEIDLPLTIDGVKPSSGAASAWTVMPRTLQRTLAPKEMLEVLVRFTPKTPGEHNARLAIDIGGEDRSVLLEGFANGELLDRTSFYACSCSGPGAPSRGWPIVLAVFMILRRRRC